MTDAFTDIFRWWGATGALLAIFAIGNWYRNGLPMLAMDARRLAAVTMFFTMIAILLAGTIIPWASDGRIEGFTQDSLPYHLVMLTAWVAWASSAWAAAVALAERKMMMIGGSITWFAVAALASQGTIGAQL